MARIKMSDRECWQGYEEIRIHVTLLVEMYNCGATLKRIEVFKNVKQSYCYGYTFSTYLLNT
jgi:hypothetical protein